MAIYLVTGGAGFIGSHVAEFLVGKGHHVRVIDNLCTGYESNLVAFREQVDFHRMDICQTENLAALMADVDCVFHLAALASVPLSVEHPKKVNEACVDGTLSVLQAARHAGVRRVVYSASSACYGDQPFCANRETDITEPLSPYAVAKLTGELYCQSFFRTYGLETVALRYFNVFGPRQDPNSHYAAVIPIFLSKILQGESPTIFGDGLQSRDFTFVENVVQANWLASQAEGVAGEVFNIAGGKSITLLTLVEQLSDLLGTDVDPIHAEPRAGEIRDSMADITRAHQRLGYEPSVSFQEGLRKSIDYYRAAFSSANPSINTSVSS